MLQLANDDSFEKIDELTKAMHNGRTLLRILVSGPDASSDRAFSVGCSRNQSAFPLLSAELAKVSARFKYVSKMPQTVKSELKRQLLLDIAPLIAQTEDYVSGEKQFNTEDVPAGLDECSSKLEELEKTKKLQIEKLNEELETLETAKSMIKMVSQLKEQADQISTDLQDAVPTPSNAEAARAAKKQKKGD